MIHGIINVYKEKGFTSHDVVAKLRGIVHQKKKVIHRMMWWLVFGESSDKRRSVIPERLTRMRKECFRCALDGQQNYVIS